MEYRQSRKWYVSISVVAIFSFILAMMIYYMSEGKDVTDGWKEILLLMLGGFVGSFAKVIDFWFNNQENDNKLLEMQMTNEEKTFSNISKNNQR